jgi:hypothetical protein
MLARASARFQQSSFKTQQDDLIANSMSKSCAKATITKNYASLPREVEVEARADAALIKGLIRRTTQDVIDTGLALIRQKNALPHGCSCRGSRPSSR